jgi:hypothetical protein
MERQRKQGRRAVLAAGALTLAAVAGSVGAMMEGQTDAGGQYISGGVSINELSEMKAQAERYTLWLVTAARGSGAYLAGVPVRITNQQGELVLEHEMDGPWLMADLQPGRYQVEAQHNGQTQRRTVTVTRRGGAHQVVMYFNDDAEVSPDWVNPFQGQAVP